MINQIFMNSVMPGRPSSPSVILLTFEKETPKVILLIIESKMYVSGKLHLPFLVLLQGLKMKPCLRAFG